MKTLIRLFYIVLLTITLPTVVIAASDDFPGSEDHPLVTRYPGSVIAWHDVQNFIEFNIPTGSVSGYKKIDKWLEIEGKLTRIYYVLEGEHTVSEVYANYLSAIKNAKFEVLARKLFGQYSRSTELGSQKWLGVAYSQRLPGGAGIQLLQGSATIGGSAYIAAKLSRPQGDIYLSLAASQQSQNKVVFFLDIVEVAAVKDDLISVDADAMSKALDVYGKVALYGIFFDHDKATIKPESKPALSEIATLLKARSQLTLYVVGHTDMKGGLDYNKNLSMRRATSVVKTLTKQYSIKASRLTPQGVGPLAPVMGNQSDSGRAKNRRVELVQK